MTHVSVVVVGGGADDDVRVVDSSTPLSNNDRESGGNGIMTNGGAELSDLSRSLSTTSSQVRVVYHHIGRFLGCVILAAWASSRNLGIKLLLNPARRPKMIFCAKKQPSLSH